MRTDVYQAAPKSEPNWTLFFGILIAGVIAIQLVLTWTLMGLFDSWDRAGQFGDMSGAINTLFSAVAFAALTLAVWMQRHELSLQREQLALQRYELQLTREELRRSADAQALSATIIEKQLAVAQDSFKLQLTTAAVTFQPDLSFQVQIENADRSMKIACTNHGPEVRELQAMSGGRKLDVTPREILRTRSCAWIAFPGPITMPDEVHFDLYYTDKADVRWASRWKCIPVSGSVVPLDGRKRVDG